MIIIVIPRILFVLGRHANTAAGYEMNAADRCNVRMYVPVASVAPEDVAPVRRLFCTAVTPVVCWKTKSTNDDSDENGEHQSARVVHVVFMLFYRCYRGLRSE